MFKLSCSGLHLTNRLFPDIVVTNDRKKGEGDYVHADIGSRGGVLGGLKPSSDFGPLPPWFFNDLPNFAQLPEVSQAIVKAQLTGKGDIQHSFFAFSRDFLGLVLKEPGNEELVSSHSPKRPTVLTLGLPSTLTPSIRQC